MVGIGVGGVVGGVEKSYLVVFGGLRYCVVAVMVRGFLR